MIFPPEALRERLSDLMQKLSDNGADPVVAARQLLAVDPDHAASYCVLGNASARDGNRAEAERLLWKGLELQPFGCLLYTSLADLYGQDRAAKAAAKTLWVLALWAAALGEEVPKEFADVFQNDPDAPDLDYTDPEAYRTIAEEQEGRLGRSVIPAGLSERLRPYWLLKELARGARDGLSEDVLQQIRAEASQCVPVWWAALRAWGREQGDTSAEALMMIVALLGEYGGPAVLEDLWELSILRAHGIFLHSHWAIFRMAQRFPAETIRSIWAAIPAAGAGLRCGMAEHLGLMIDVAGVEAAIVALMKDFSRLAQDRNAAYLLLASAHALIETGHPTRAKELLEQYERLLTKEGRRWVSETLDAPEGFVPHLVDDGIPGLDIEDVCLNRVLMEDEQEEGDEPDDEWEDDEEDEPVVAAPKPGRNDPCWCGSGKKYKKCHLDADEEAAHRQTTEQPDDDPVRTQAMEGLLATADRVRKRRDMMEAARQYFGDEVPEEAQMQEGSEGFFLWYLYDFRPESTGRTAVEEHLRKHEGKLSPEVVEALEAWRDSRYSLFKVGAAQEGKGIELHDFYSGDVLLAAETKASRRLRSGELVLARLEEWHGRLEFSGEILPVTREALPPLKKFVETGAKAARQAPAEFVRANIHRLHRVVKDL